MTDNTPADAETVTLADIIPMLKQGKEWRIVVHGVNEPNKQQENEHHMKLLDGLVGKSISADKRTLSTFHFQANETKVTVHIGSHADCNVTHDEVDLLLLFLPVNRDALDESYDQMIKKITDAHGPMVWKHSVVVLTGVDNIVAEYEQKGNVQTRFETLLDSWTTQLQRSLKEAIGDQEGISASDVLIRPAGKQAQADLPKPHEKWFSCLWHGCFLSSKVESMPAILKVAQNRIEHSVDSSDLQLLAFHTQSIQVKDKIQLPKNVKAGLGVGGGSAIAGAAVGGATVGALIGALAIGIPSFGVAAGVGLVLGGVIGGGAGAGIAGAAVGGGYKAAMDKQLQQIDTSELKLYYADLLTRIPSLRSYLTAQAEKLPSCKIVVAGIEDEGISTVAAGLIGKRPREVRGSGDYWQQIVPGKANLIVQDYPEIPKVANKQDKAKELITFMKSKTGKHADLLVFCVPMTSSKQDFVYSPHLKYLERLCEVSKDDYKEEILSNTVIALTHAHEMRAEMTKRNDLSQTSFTQFFKNELEGWKRQFREVFERYIHIQREVTEKVPILPVGNHEHSLDLSDNEQPSPATQYHWLSEFLLHAMPATKPEGLPTLIKSNRKRIREHPNDYRDQNNTPELIIQAQCQMLSGIGKKDKGHPGEAVGIILGCNEEQNW